MPTYDFRDTETGKEFQVDMKISEYDNYLKENPTHQRAWNPGSAPNIGRTTVNLNSKIPDWHKDNMKEMKKIHPKGNYGILD